MQELPGILGEDVASFEQIEDGSAIWRQECCNPIWPDLGDGKLLLETMGAQPKDNEHALVPVDVGEFDLFALEVVGSLAPLLPASTWWLDASLVRGQSISRTRDANYLAFPHRLA